MLNSVFSDLCVDYGPGNDTVVLGSPVKPGMTMMYGRLQARCRDSSFVDEAAEEADVGVRV